MMKDFEYDKLVLILKQADAFIINNKLASIVLEEKLTGEKKQLVLFWSEGITCSQLSIYEDSNIRFDGQVFEIRDRNNYCYDWTITPLLKLRKWEDY